MPPNISSDFKKAFENVTFDAVMSIMRALFWISTNRKRKCLKGNKVTDASKVCLESDVPTKVIKENVKNLLLINTLFVQICFFLV